MTYEYRLAQLKKLHNILIQEKETFAEAIYKDLRRTPETTYIVEIDSLISELDYFIANFKVIFKIKLINYFITNC